MIVKIISIDPSILKWRSLKSKVNQITNTLKTMRNVGNVVVEVIVDETLKPVVNKGRVTHTFMESVSKKYAGVESTFVVLHMSEAQRTALGIQPTLRGLAFNDDNFISEAYVWADENTRRGRFNQFVEVVLHELSHLMYHRSGGVDMTHEWHDKWGTIKGIFKQHDYRKYQKSLISSLTSWIVNRIGPQSLQPLIERKAQLIVDDMAKLGYTVHVFEGFRSVKRQNELYAQGRNGDKRPIVTNAKGGESLHNYGVAVDIVFGPKGRPSWNPKEPWKILGDVGKKHGFEWGGDWKGFTDLPHFEMRLGYTLAHFQTKQVDYSKFV